MSNSSFYLFYPAELRECGQDYISLIANSLYLYLATLTQLYLFLCYKMNTQRTRPDQHSAVKVALDDN